MRGYGALTKQIMRRSRSAGRNDDEYLFRSAANAERLMRAYNNSLAGRCEPFTVQQLRAELGLA